MTEETSDAAVADGATPRTTTSGSPTTVIHEGLPTQLPDIDPDETTDWLESFDQLEDSVLAATAEPGPALIEFTIEQEANVFPMIPPGGSLSEPIEGNPPPLVPV